MKINKIFIFFLIQHKNYYEHKDFKNKQTHIYPDQSEAQSSLKRASSSLMNLSCCKSRITATVCLFYGIAFPAFGPVWTV